MKPYRLREHVIGALNLFSKAPRSLDADTAALEQALADVATIGLLEERAARTTCCRSSYSSR